MTTFEYQESSGVVICKLIVNNRIYVSSARCHPNDTYSKRVGERLSYDRASIKYLREKCNELVMQLKGLRHLLSIYNQSSQVKKENYEYRMLSRQIAALENDICEMKYVIDEIKEVDKQYVKNYARIIRREKANSNNS